MSKRKHTEPSKTADPLLASTNPTAQSPEFVPKSVPDTDAAFSNRSDAVFDIIPSLKGNKYK